MLIHYKKIIKKKRFWAGLLLVQFLLFYVFSKLNFAITFFERFFDFQKYIHQKVFSVFPFSVGDLLYMISGIIFIYFFIKILKRKSRNLGLFQILVILNVLYFSYQIFWGMLYFQKPIIEKLPESKMTTEEIKTLSLKYLHRCIETRNHVNEDKNGVFTILDLNKIETEILKNQAVLPAFLIKKNVTEINSFKPSLFGNLMSYTGVFGYYNPFTAEAMYNAKLPSTSLPFTLAHESSHQLGYAREQEANFIGYLIGKNSENLDLKYSTEYFVLKSLLNSLAEKNPDFVKEVIKNYSPEMKRDRSAEKIFIKKHEGFLDTFFGFTNDIFLKSNQQEGSITYSYFVDLLMRYKNSESKEE